MHFLVTVQLVFLAENEVSIKVCTTAIFVVSHTYIHDMGYKCACRGLESVHLTSSCSFAPLYQVVSSKEAVEGYPLPSQFQNWTGLPLVRLHIEPRVRDNDIEIYEYTR